MVTARAARESIGRMAAMTLLVLALTVSAAMGLGGVADKAHAEGPDASPIAYITDSGQTIPYSEYTSLAADVALMKNRDFVITMNCDWDMNGNDAAAKPTTRLIIPSNSYVTLDMQGHMIDRGLTHGAQAGAVSNGEVITVEEGTVLIINGGPQDGAHAHEAYEYQTEAPDPTSPTVVEDVNGGYITGGCSTNGPGGILVKTGSSATLNDVTIGGCRAQSTNPSKSGGIMLGYGGGMYLKGGGISVNMNNSTIAGNYACGDGGGIYADDAGNVDVNLVDSHIDRNYAKSDGGGVDFDGKHSALRGDSALAQGTSTSGGTQVTGSTVRDNRAFERGGGILAWNSDVSIVDVAVQNNRSAKNGGGIYVAQDKAALRDLIITGNAGDYGGGIYFAAGSSDEKNYAGDTVIDHCTVTRNYAYTLGGGIYCDEHSSINGKRTRMFSGVTVIKDNDVAADGNTEGLNLCIESKSWDVKSESFNLSEGSDVYASWLAKGSASRKSAVVDANCANYISSDQPEWCYRYNVKERHIVRVLVSEAPLVPEAVTIAADNANDASQKGKSGTATVSGKCGTVGTGGTAGSEFNLIRGFASHGNTEEISAFYYSDALFYPDPYTYNEHLAAASITFAYCGGYMNASAEEKNGNTYYNKHWGARQFLADIGCPDQNIYVSDNMLVKPGTDSIGVSIGSKELARADGTKTGDVLVPVTVRGFGYEAEWASNVTIGFAAEMSANGKEAKGFANAADQVFAEIQYYLKKYNLEDAYKAGKVKFWITGFSRAGATANLVSKRLVDKIATDKCGSQVFCYSCEAPKGGTNAAEVSGNDYTCIHNMINKVDIVPYVAPGQMGFKRYGVDHFVPGTSAGAVKSTTKGVDYGGAQSPSTVTTYADNNATLTKTNAYEKQRPLMLQHLTALNPTMTFNDNFQPQAMDFISTSGFLHVYDEGDYNDNHIEDFVEDFIWLLVEKSEISRDQYAKDNYTLNGKTYSSIQAAARDLMEIEKTGSGLTGVLNNAGNIKDYIPYYVPSIGMTDKNADFSLFKLYTDVIGEWGNMIESKKEYWTNGLWNALKKTGALDKLTAEEKAKFEKAFPTLLNVALTVVDGDYNYKPKDNNSNQWAKGSNETMMYIPTLMAHMNYILQCHDPNVDIAWAQSYDSWYKNERDNYKLAQPGSVAAPKAYGTVGDKQQELTSTAGQVNKLPGDQEIILENDAIVGEAVYYDLIDETNGEKVIATNQLYRGGVDLMLGDASSKSYRITTYDMSYGVPSETKTYSIELFNDRHNVIVMDLEPGGIGTTSASSADSSGTESVQATGQGGDGRESALMAGSIPEGALLQGQDSTNGIIEGNCKRTYTFEEGQQALVQARVPAANYFKMWRVEVLDEHGTVISGSVDVASALLPKSTTSASATFSMPKVGDAYGTASENTYPAGYQLQFTALYLTKTTAMTAIPERPVAQHALPDTMRFDFDGISATYDIAWFLQSEGDESETPVPAGEAALPGVVYRATVVIGQDPERAVFDPSSVGIGVGGPDAGSVKETLVVRDVAPGSIVVELTFKPTEGETPDVPTELRFKVQRVDLNTSARIPGETVTEYYVKPNSTVTLTARNVPNKAFVGWDFGESGIKTADGETAPSDPSVDVQIPANLPKGTIIDSKYVPLVSKVAVNLYDEEGNLFTPEAGESNPSRAEMIITVGDEYEVNPETLSVLWSPELPVDGRFAPLTNYVGSVKVSVKDGERPTISVRKKGSQESFRDVGITSLITDNFKASFNGATQGVTYDFAQGTVSKVFDESPYVLAAVKQPDNVSGVPYDQGSDAEKVSAWRPATTTILMTHGAELEAAINWGAPTVTEGGGTFEPAVWTVTGTVDLPTGVTNPDEVSLSVSMTVSVECAGTALSPTASLEPGEYLYNQETKLDTHGEGGTTYYTTDGSDPRVSTTAQVYDGKAIYVDRRAASRPEVSAKKAFVVKAYTTGGVVKRDSDVATYEYTFSDIPVPKGAVLEFDNEEPVEQVGIEYNAFYTFSFESEWEPKAWLDYMGNCVAIYPGVYKVKATLNANTGADRWATNDETGYSAEDQIVEFIITGDQGDNCTIATWPDPPEGGVTTGSGTYKKDTEVTVAATANSGFSFVNWMQNDSESKEVVSNEAVYSFTVTGGRLLAADFGRILTVRWLDGDGSEIYQTTYNEYDAEPEYPADQRIPTRESTTAYDFEFREWDSGKVSDTVKTYKPLFDATLRQYDVTFVDDDGTVLKEPTKYDYDTLPEDLVVPSDPVKPATAQYTYAFDKWVNAETGEGIETVIGDTVYKATYTATLNKYKVTFKNYDGAVLKGPDEYDYGTTADSVVKPPDPARPADAQYTYEFAGWDPAIADVAADATYTAQFTSVPIPPGKAALTFDFAGGTLNGKTSLTIVANVGDVITIPDAPTKEGYDFKYWKGSEYYPGDKYTVKDNHAFTAVWEQQKPAPSPDGGDTPDGGNTPSGETTPSGGDTPNAGDASSGGDTPHNEGTATKPVNARSTAVKTGDAIPIVAVCVLLVAGLAVALVARRKL